MKISIHYLMFIAIVASHANTSICASRGMEVLRALTRHATSTMHYTKSAQSTIKNIATKIPPSLFVRSSRVQPTISENIITQSTELDAKYIAKQSPIWNKRIKQLLQLATGTIGLASASVGLASKLHNEELKKRDTLASKIGFERESMTHDIHYHNKLVEGYWANSTDPDKDCYKGKYPFPIAHEKPWKGQDEFLARLYLIEQSEKTQVNLYRGLSHSRFEPKKSVGCYEFEIKDSNNNVIAWPEAFRWYYVSQYNVKPSRSFYEFVMTYPLPQSEKEIAAIKSKALNDTGKSLRQKYTEQEQREFIKRYPEDGKK